MTNLVEDLSVITTIPVKTLNTLFDRVEYCIVDAVKETMLAGRELTEINLGFGLLYIKHDNSQLKYKFIPTQDLNNAMSNLFKNKLNSLESQLEKSLVEKITNTYKELL